MRFAALQKIVVLLAATAVAMTPSVAVDVRTWSAGSVRELADGTVDGTSVDARRGIVLAPVLERLWGPEVGIVWDLVPLGEDGALLALSGPGRVLRAGISGTAAVWYEGGPEELVTALAAGGDGAVIFGSSPGGAVRIARDSGEIETLAETGSEYVWALEGDGEGGLWIATGAPGLLLHLAGGGGQPDRVYESGDDPVRSLARIPAGGVVAGTGKQGRILRVGGSGDVEVLFDAEEEEIVSVAVAPDGTVWALAAHRAAPVPRTTTPPARTGDANGSQRTTEAPENNGEPQARVRVTTSASVPAEPAPAKPAASPAGGALYRITAERDVSRVWSARNGLPLALALDADGVPLVATGGKGRILRIHPDAGESVWLAVGSERATALSVTAGGALLVGSSEDAGLDLAGPGTNRQGSYLGATVDAGWIADWGALEWHGSVPRGAGAAFQVRSGNTSEPDDTWSAWKDLDEVPAGEAVRTLVPQGRYFQVRLALRAARDGGTPHVRRLQVSYLTRNRPPEIARLEVDDPGVAWRKGPVPSAARPGSLVADDPVARKTRAKLKSGARAGGQIRKSYEPGVRSFHWDATDPDGDRLKFRLEIRAEDDGGWFPLAEDIDTEFYSWDGRGLPDGRYRVRLTADDAPDNAVGRNRTTRDISDLFVMDGTPPVLADVRVSRDPGQYRIRLRAEDATGTVAAMEYMLDGGPWRVLDPMDGVSDSGIEEYRIQIERLDREEVRHLVVRVADRSGNISGKRIVLRGE